MSTGFIFYNSTGGISMDLTSYPARFYGSYIKTIPAGQTAISFAVPGIGPLAFGLIYNVVPDNNIVAPGDVIIQNGIANVLLACFLGRASSISEDQTFKVFIYSSF